MGMCGAWNKKNNTAINSVLICKVCLRHVLASFSAETTYTKCTSTLTHEVVCDIATKKHRRGALHKSKIIIQIATLIVKICIFFNQELMAV